MEDTKQPKGTGNRMNEVPQSSPQCPDQQVDDQTRINERGKRVMMQRVEFS